MKFLVTLAFSLCLSVLFTPAAMTAVVHDEAVDGDLSSDPATPTPKAFALGGNTILGTCGNLGTPVDIRDYITFTVPAGHLLVSLNLLVWDPNNLGFASFNAGATSFIPSPATAASFLAGIHPSGENVGTDLMPLFVTNSVTGNALPGPRLTPGTYCFLIQQTTPILQVYSLEFVLEAGVPAGRTTWGAMKSLYR